MTFSIPVDPLNGVADPDTLSFSWDDPSNHHGRRPTAISFGDKSFFQEEQKINLKPEFLEPVKRMVDGMRSHYTNSPGSRFRFAVPSGLSAVSQASYFGSSHIYSRSHAVDCEEEELSPEELEFCLGNNEGWSNMNNQSNFLRRAPVLAASVHFDLTETATANLFSQIERFGCILLRSPTACNGDITRRSFRINSTSFIEPRKVF